MTIRSSNNPYLPYPPHRAYRGGVKVGWYLYETEEQAKLASKAAQHNARIKEGLGYDFGFCAPGTILPNDDGTFEVCIP